MLSESLRFQELVRAEFPQVVFVHLTFLPIREGPVHHQHYYSRSFVEFDLSLAGDIALLAERSVDVVVLSILTCKSVVVVLVME